MGELGKGELPHLSPVVDGPWFTLPFADILQSYSAKMYAYFCFYININTIYISIYTNIDRYIDIDIYMTSNLHRK